VKEVRNQDNDLGGSRSVINRAPTEEAKDGSDEKIGGGDTGATNSQNEKSVPASHSSAQSHQSINNQ